ncbi:CBS domain-containing protein [Thalassotalea atypica]|uniref:CBS domain-containing protein n=1 Tax=Thalassotalea atypica TaxID=2054316 RepID=UPI002573C81A|nr:CBS domain-containing protein [Thalassotalea atypica]
MSVANIMTRDMISLELDQTLNDAKQIFESNNIHHIIVLNDDLTLAGLITDRDLYKHLSPTIGTSKETRQDSMMLRKKIHLVMTRDIITARGDLSINEAAFRFYEHHISCLPIVDNNNCPVGIITWRDIIKLLAYQFKRKQAMLNS